MGDKSSVPLLVENISSLLKRQPGVARLEQRLPSNGGSGWQSDSLHRAVLSHRDNGLSQRRLGDHVDLVLASHEGAATDLVSNVFHLLCHKRGESGQPSWAEQREGGGDDPTRQRTKQQPAQRGPSWFSTTSTNPPLPSSHPAEGSRQGPAAGRGHPLVLPSIHTVGEKLDSLYFVLRTEHFLAFIV